MSLILLLCVVHRYLWIVSLEFYHECHLLWLKNITNTPLSCHSVMHQFLRQPGVVYNSTLCYHNVSRCHVSLSNLSRIKFFTTRSPHRHTVVINVQLELRFEDKDYIVSYGVGRIPSSEIPFNRMKEMVNACHCL